MPLASRGLNPDGSCNHLTVGKIEIPYISMSYGDNLKAEWVWESGKQTPVDDTPGQYEPEEGSLKVSARIARVLIFPLLPQFGAGNVRKEAIVNFVHPEIGSDSDALHEFRIMGAKASTEAGGKPNEIEFKIRYKLVLWTEKRICIGNPFGTGVSGSVRI